jgi:hypothetical protein
MQTIALALLAALTLTGCKRSESDPSASPTLADMSGNYTITSAQNPGQATAYKGTVQIEKKTNVYQLEWTITGSTPYHGVALPTADGLGVGWGRGDKYGVVIYTVSGGSLHGVWATSDSDNVGTEDLTGPATLGGVYSIANAALPKGGSYTGQVTITPTGDTYAVAWKLTGGQGYAGVGIKDGDNLIVGWGTENKEAGVVDYKLRGGALVGTWAIPGGTALGQETLGRM